MSRRWQLETPMYATWSDYEPLIRALEAPRRLQYVLCGVLESPVPSAFASGLEIPELGVAKTGNSVTEDMYLILDASLEVQSSRVELYRGGTRYEFGPSENLCSIVFQPGGTFGEEAIIVGNVNTASRDAGSVALYRAFVREIRKHFTSVRGFWLGPEALQRFRAGARLTSDVRVLFYDLKPEPLALPPPL